MRVKLTGYFKFSPIEESFVKVSQSAFGEAMIRRAAGFSEHLRVQDRDRDAVNAILGECSRLRWYKNRGWMPNGSFSVRCPEKNKGDILGVCASLGMYARERIWLYCDRKFEEEMTMAFADPEDVIRHPFSIRNCLVDMANIPDQAWLDSFCEKTHDPDAFARRRRCPREEAAKLAEMRPEMAAYVKLMWRI